VKPLIKLNGVNQDFCNKSSPFWLAIMVATFFCLGWSSSFLNNVVAYLYYTTIWVTFRIIPYVNWYRISKTNIISDKIRNEREFVANAFISELYFLFLFLFLLFYVNNISFLNILPKWKTHNKLIQMVLIGFLSPFINWFDGGIGKRKYTYSRLLLVVIIVLLTVLALPWYWDLLIECITTFYPFPIFTLLIILLFITTSIIMTLLFTNQVFWKTKWINKIITKAILSYAQKDPEGIRYAHFRHKYWHNATKIGRKLFEINKGISWTWNILLGKVPDIIDKRSNYKPNRFSIFLYFSMRNLFLTLLSKEQCYRNILLLKLIPYSITNIYPELNQDIQDEENIRKSYIEYLYKDAQTLLCAYNYTICPINKCFYSDLNRVSQRLMFRMDWVVTQSILLGEENDSLFRKLENILINYYNTIIDCTNGVNQKIFVYLLERYQSQQKEKKIIKSLLEFRELILDWIPKQTNNYIEKAKCTFVVNVLLSQYRLIFDWQGIIETCRMLNTCSYILKKHDHFDLGEAYFKLSLKVNDKNTVTWIREQVISRFYCAGNLSLLKKINFPLVQDWWYSK